MAGTKHSPAEKDGILRHAFDQLKARGVGSPWAASPNPWTEIEIECRVLMRKKQGRRNRGEKQEKQGRRNRDSLNCALFLRVFQCTKPWNLIPGLATASLPAPVSPARLNRGSVC